MRESGMPDPAYWDSFFDPEAILDRLCLDRTCRDLLEFGCGYGTFTLPAARRVAGQVYALDLDPGMLDITRQRAADEGLGNIEYLLRDFVADGSGLRDASVDYAMLFNILHGEEPVGLLAEARRNLAPGGRLGIIHWNHDEATPRGPPLSIRPRPEQCARWAVEAGFTPASDTIDLPPYHYGLLLEV
ncbi:MAG: class I SAM-dependent methyltransferase [Woeseiaceae bacterium]|nr:class I SAM-dependent methyltransferase [Woeseiaceae bacterium]